jgi:hypothetical protein
MATGNQAIIRSGTRLKYNVIKLRRHFLFFVDDPDKFVHKTGKVYKCIYDGYDTD